MNEERSPEREPELPEGRALVSRLFEQKQELLPHLELQKSLSAIWLQSIARGEKRREYKVPARIQWLPCGCSRDRGNEVDTANAWTIVRKKDKYVHKSCGTELAID